MIKYYCNNKECQKEIDTKYFFAELTIRESSSILMPVKGQKGVVTQEIREKKYHFCRECLKKLLQEAKS